MENIIEDREIVLEPTDNEWESYAVLNPATIVHKGVKHIFYRAVKAPNFSTIGHGVIDDEGKIIRDKEPLLVPSLPEEREGIEDPRITFIEDTFYMLYTAWDGNNARIGLATSKDLINFEKKGIISPKITIDKAIKVTKSRLYKYKWNQQRCRRGGDSTLWNKDAILLPEKIDGKFVMFHRFNPCIQVAMFEKFEDLTENYWKEEIKNIDQRTIKFPEEWWESHKVGGGAVPIKTDEGWLFFYHGRDVLKWYRCGALLLDLENPTKVLGATKEPLLEPHFDWEIHGVVDKVIFVQGAFLEGDNLEIYYGAADKLIARTTISLAKIIGILK